MVKRILALGAAVALILSLSVVSFADSPSDNAITVSDSFFLGFPFYSRTRVRQNGTELYYGSAGNPITSDSAENLNGAGGTIVFDFYSRQQALTITNSGEVDVMVPDYNTQYSFTPDMSVEYNNQGQITYIENPVSGYQGRFVYGNMDFDINQIMSVEGTKIQAGTYVIDGELSFPANSIGSVDNFISMITSYSGSIVTNSGTYDIDFKHQDYEFHQRGDFDRINFRISVDIPVSGIYNRFFFQIGSKLNSQQQPLIPSLKGFSVSTGAITFEKASSIQGFSALVGNWFNSTISAIKSGFFDLRHLMNANRDDAGEAAKTSDQQSVDTAQSQVAAVESFEASTSQSINSGVSTINNSGYLTVPDYTSSSSGMGAALAAVGLIFAGVFNCLGGYQVVITVPLVLGIMLILVGRGTLALGRVMSANARAARRHEGGGHS